MPDLEHDLREYFDELSARVERRVDEVDYPTAPTRRHRGRHLVLVAAVALAVLASLVAVITAGRRDEGRGSGSPVTVEYEHLEYAQRAQLRCAALPGRGFESMDIETWADRAGKRWRTRVTYPDGSTRDVVAEGSPWYPTDHFSRGEVRGATLGCKQSSIGILVAEPGQGGVVSLNPLADDPGRVGSGNVPLVPTYRDVAESLPGTQRDSRGRLARVWREVIGGTTGSGSSRPSIRIAQTHDWYVIGDQVVEERYVNRYAGAGTGRWSLTLVGSGRRTVPGDWFDTAGYRDLGPVQVPSGGGGSVTTLVSHGMLTLVSGTLEMVGGLSTASVDPVGGLVSAVDSAGRVVRSAHAAENGHFSMALPPGRYQLVARSPNYNDGLGQCQSDGALAVGNQWVKGALVLCQRK
ncbi:MAG: carboxypeptidase regulatory-like domain-containing protein [Acidimicrobiia bacterium]|nr:carboxypeptidase regulatory-like domain-containing protein [Acidimicrobiia bacterium]